MDGFRQAGKHRLRLTRADGHPQPHPAAVPDPGRPSRKLPKFAPATRASAADIALVSSVEVFVGMRVIGLAVATRSVTQSKVVPREVTLDIAATHWRGAWVTENSMSWNSSRSSNSFVLKVGSMQPVLSQAARVSCTPSPAERSQAERVSSNLEWLAQAGAHEREHGRYSLLRRDLRAVRVEIRRLNRFFRANGEVDRIIYRENPVLSLLRGWAALGSVRRPSTTRVSA